MTAAAVAIIGAGLPSLALLFSLTRPSPSLPAGKSLMELILEQFDDLLVKILLLAAIISFVSTPADAELSGPRLFAVSEGVNFPRTLPKI